MNSSQLSCQNERKKMDVSCIMDIMITYFISMNASRTCNNFEKKYDNEAQYGSSSYFS